MTKTRFRPQLLQLEDRLVPAVSLEVVDLNNDGFKDLRIIGGSENTRVILREDGAAQEVLLSLDINGDHDFTDVGDFQDRALVASDGFDWHRGQIILSLGGGNDRVDYQIGGGDWTALARVMQTNLGGGGNLFQFQSDARILDSSLTLDLRSGKGNDTYDFDHIRGSDTQSNIENSQVAISVSMGGGWDIFLMELTNRISIPPFDNIASGVIDKGSLVTVDVNGGAGRNYCYIDVDTIGNTAQSAFAVNYVGGDDRGGDRLIWRLLGDVGNSSSVDLRANLLAGKDIFTGQLSPASFDLTHADAQVHWYVDGGAGNDQISVSAIANPNDYSMELAGWLDVTLLGGGGKDKMDFHFPSNASFILTGRLTLLLKGGGGNDQLGVVISNTANSTGVYDVTIQGNGGNDRVNFLLNKAGAAVTFGPQGKIVINGGGGKDRYVPGQPFPADLLVELFEKFGP